MPPADPPSFGEPTEPADNPKDEQTARDIQQNLGNVKLREEIRQLVEGFDEQVKSRAKLGPTLFYIVCTWLGFIIVMLAFAMVGRTTTTVVEATTRPAAPGVIETTTTVTETGLPTPVLVALLGTGLTAIVGLAYVVAQWAFPNRGRGK